MLFFEGREAIRVHPCVVNRTTFLLFANRAIAATEAVFRKGDFKRALGELGDRENLDIK